MNQPNWVSIEDVPPGRYGPLTIFPPAVSNTPIDPSVRTVELVPARPGPLTPKPISRERLAAAIECLGEQERTLMTRLYLDRASEAAVAGEVGLTVAELRKKKSVAWHAISDWLRANKPPVTSAAPPG